MLALFAFLQVISPPKVASPLPPKPGNILIIIGDDVGVDQVGSYARNYEGLTLDPCTPNLDMLAATGMRFTNAWSNPVCSPTRAQILTGKHGQNTGVGDVSLPSNPASPIHGMQSDEPTIASILPGWATACVGKWHLSDSLQDLGGFKHPLEVGFDSYAGTLYGLSDYDDWTKTVSPPGIQVYGYDVYTTTDTIDDALDLVQTLPEPWLLLVSPFSSHKPFHCPSSEGHDPESCVPGECSVDWCMDCDNLAKLPQCVGAKQQACLARAMTHALDAEIGRLLSVVDAEDTAVVFAGDNGTPEAAIAAPFDPAHPKGTLYQGGINVPLIVRVPGGETGECHELVGMTDLFATVADLAGVTPVESPGRDSVSLLQYLMPGLDPSAQPRRYVYAEFFPDNFPHQPDWGVPPGFKTRYHVRAVRNELFKLISFVGFTPDARACENRLELYRLASHPDQDPAFGPDPFEQTDLLTQPGGLSALETAALADLVNQLDTYFPQLPTICR